MILKRKCPICSRYLRESYSHYVLLRYNKRTKTLVCKTKKHSIILDESGFIIRLNKYEILSSKALNRAIILKNDISIFEVDNYIELNYIQEIRQLINKAEKLNIFK